MNTITNISNVTDNSGQPPIVTESNPVSTIINDSPAPIYYYCYCYPCRRCCCRCRCCCCCNCECCTQYEQ
ncbi:MAG: hypothetical protein HDT28_09500 [Clostridiales bacterium]|nr:hypothetical protein [Clostridiales bacterium]